MAISKNKLKYIRSLRQKKFRQKYNKFIAEGDKLSLEILQSERINIELLVGVEEWVEQYRPLLRKCEETIVVSERELKQMSALQTPNQVLVVADIPTNTIDEAIVQSDWSLYLETIQDPGNIGTILRIADWFGIQHVFCSPDTADIFNSKVIQSTMGAFLRTRIVRITFEDLQHRFPDVPSYGAVLRGKSIYKQKLPSNGILVMGNESKGIPAAMQAQLSGLITIPPHRASGMESLNVGVATGIICAALRNQVGK